MTDPAKVTRLPVQHRNAPHCPTCKASLPAFDGLSLNLSASSLGDSKLTAVTLHVTCKCGAQWDLKKALK